MTNSSGVSKEAGLTHRKVRRPRRSRSDLLVLADHEIRTPLNGIVGMAELLLGTSLTPEQREYVQAIRASSDVLHGVVRNLLDALKLDTRAKVAARREFDLRRLLEGVMELFTERAREKGVELLLDADREVPRWVVGDNERTRQLFVHLVGHALRCSDRGEVSIRLHAANETGSSVQIILAVKSCSSEMRPERVKGARAAGPGVGEGGPIFKTELGVEFCRQIAASLGGELWAVEGAGGGTIVSASVPLEKSPGHKESACPDFSEDLHHLRVLVIDDSAESCSLIRSQLEKWGCEVAESDNGADAVHTLLGAREDPFHVAVIDLDMPDVDGLQTAVTIKDDPRLKSTSVVLMVPRRESWTAEKMRSYGISQCISKPVYEDELHQSLRGISSTTANATRGARRVGADRDLSAEEPLRVLLVEDDAVSQLAARRLISRFGHTVECVSDGEQAVASFSAGRYDLVFMDVQLPGMNGFEATSALREIEKRWSLHVPIIAITACAQEEDRQRCLDAGMDDYVSKPVDGKQLGDVLAWWGTWRAEQEHEQRNEPEPKKSPAGYVSFLSL